jgi:hypothetical protein
MEPTLIISIVSFILIWGSSLITLWVKLKVKLAEIDLKMEQNYIEFKEHCRWGQEEQRKNELKFEKVSVEVKESNKELMFKIDYLIEKLNNLAIYVERQQKTNYPEKNVSKKSS